MDCRSAAHLVNAEAGSRSNTLHDSVAGKRDPPPGRHHGHGRAVTAGIARRVVVGCRSFGTPRVLQMHVRANGNDLPAREPEVLGAALRVAGDSVKGLVPERFVVEVEPRVDDRDPEPRAVDRRVGPEPSRGTQPHDIFASDGIEEVLESACPHDTPDTGHQPRRIRLIRSGQNEQGIQHVSGRTEDGCAGGLDLADDRSLRAFHGPCHLRVVGRGQPARHRSGTCGTRERQPAADRRRFQNNRIAMRLPFGRLRRYAWRADEERERRRDHRGPGRSLPPSARAPRHHAVRLQVPRNGFAGIATE